MCRGRIRKAILESMISINFTRSFFSWKQLTESMVYFKNSFRIIDEEKEGGTKKTQSLGDL